MVPIISCVVCSSVTTAADCFIPPPPVTSLPRTPAVDSFAAPLAPGELSCARVQRFTTNRFVVSCVKLRVILLAFVTQCRPTHCYRILHDFI